MPKTKESEKSLLKAIKRDLRWLRRNERKRIRGKGKFDGDNRSDIKFHQFINDLEQASVPRRIIHDTIASAYARSFGATFRGAQHDGPITQKEISMLLERLAPSERKRVYNTLIMQSWSPSDDDEPLLAEPTSEPKMSRSIPKPITPGPMEGMGKFSGDKRNKKVKFHEYIDDMKRIGLPLEELYKAVASLFAHNIGATYQGRTERDGPVTEEEISRLLERLPRDDRKLIYAAIMAIKQMPPSPPESDDEPSTPGIISDIDPDKDDDAFFKAMLDRLQ